MIREGWAVQDDRGHCLSNCLRFEPEAELSWLMKEHEASTVAAAFIGYRAAPVRLRVEVVPYAPEQRHGPTCLCGVCVDKG